MGTGLSVGQSEDLMLDYLRNTLITKVHFKIENLFSNILNAISANAPRGFWRIGDQTLALAAIPTRGREKDILTVLANLRNSFHANGMHHNDNLSIQIDGIDFDFIKDRPVTCAGWMHIMTAIRSNICVVDAILLSSAVCNHSGEIADAFAAANP